MLKQQIDSNIRTRWALIFLSLILCLAGLSFRDLWTQEHRWADIVSMMIYRGDYLHPYLGAVPYYDKPLLSYWLIVIASSVFGELSNLTLRLPSACFGLLGLCSAYFISKKLYNPRLASIFVLMLLSSYYYIYWARTASADIHNVAGILLAIAVYLYHRDHPRFLPLLSFFSIVAITSLFKGVVAAVVIFMVVGLDVLLRRDLKRYFTLSFFAALLCGISIFCIPFFLSSYYPDPNFVANKNSGLYLVYRENVMRFFQPFDHKGPIYTYFIYLPLYIFPWIFLFVPALIERVRAWPRLNPTSRWVLLSFLLLFLFFTASGSRRNYYILQVAPFALLIVLDWLNAYPNFISIARKIAATFVVLLFSYFVVLEPVVYAKYGMQQFLQKVAHQVPGSDLKQSEIALLGVHPKAAFYLHLPTTAIAATREDIEGKIQAYQKDYANHHELAALPRVILADSEYVSAIQQAFPSLYREVTAHSDLKVFGVKLMSSYDVVALIRKAE